MSRLCEIIERVIESLTDLVIERKSRRHLLEWRGSQCNGPSIGGCLGSSDEVRGLGLLHFVVEIHVMDGSEDVPREAESLAASIIKVRIRRVGKGLPVDHCNHFTAAENTIALHTSNQVLAPVAKVFVKDLLNS